MFLACMIVFYVGLFIYVRVCDVLVVNDRVLYVFVYVCPSVRCSFCV